MNPEMTIDEAYRYHDDHCSDFDVKHIAGGLDECQNCGVQWSAD